MTDEHQTADDDPYLWLEDVEGEQALGWARARNAEAFAELTTGERFGELKAQFLEALDADDRIPYVSRRGIGLRPGSTPRASRRDSTSPPHRTAPRCPTSWWAVRIARRPGRRC